MQTTTAVPAHAPPPATEAPKGAAEDDRAAPGNVAGARGALVEPLERALLLAAEAGRFDVVAQLARELEARRLDAAGVVKIDGARRKT